MTHFTRKRLAASIAALAVVGLLAACGGGNAEENAPEDYQDIVFWTPQTAPDRIAVQEDVATAFTAETGIGVEVVPLAAADQNQALVTGAASGDVPDVILLGTTQVDSFRTQGLVDGEAAAAIVEQLGAETFNERALEAFSADGEVGAVPSDGWVHLIAYRADLLAAAGLDVPGSLAELAEAATTLKDTQGVTGLALGTQSGTASGTEAIYSMFQSNGCELVEDGTVTIDSEECAEAAELFLELRNSSIAGDFDVTSARAAYLAGQAGMLLFSTHLLDELAGLDEANPATCPECAANPAFLAENTGFITVLDDDHPAQYGATLGYGIPTGANTTEASMFIDYLLTDGYLDTLGMATEGRIPLRNGTAENPTEFLDAWADLGMGADKSVSPAEVYGDEFVGSLAEGMNAVHLWGAGTPDALLVGNVANQGTLAGLLERLYSGEDPATVTAEMKRAVEEVQSSL